MKSEEKEMNGINGAVAVFGASSGSMKQIYYDAAFDMGRAIAESGRALVFGGGDTGIMGAAARGAHAAGGKVIGVIPEALNLPGIAYPLCDELVVTHDLRDRMAAMAEKSDAFCVLPGGFGTLYELFEVITLNQLRYMLKPVVILSTNGFYDSLAGMFEVMYREKCAREMCRRLYAVVDTPEQAMEEILRWTAPELTRWLTDVPEGELK
jgi:uncharacterized protein (TIGR00730 family)